MLDLGEYIVMALSLSVALGLIGAAAHPQLSRETEAAIGVLCLFALAAPVAAAIPSLLDPPSIEESIPALTPEGGYIELGERAFTEGISRYVAEELSVGEDEIALEVSGFDFEAMRAERITLILSGSAVLSDLRGIRQSLLGNFVAEGGSCEVVIDIDG